MQEALRKRLYIKTFGCQMNVYDSRKLARLLQNEYDGVDDPASADLILINTCSVREKPAQKLFSLLGEFRALKAVHPRLLIGVGGCVAQQEGVEILRKSSLVDFVFGTHSLSNVPSLIADRLSGGPRRAAVDYRDGWESLPLGLGGESVISQVVSISRGCNNNCAYCIVPFTRGREVSRDAGEIEAEVRLLAQAGVKEVVLLGQTVNSYGKDLAAPSDFGALIQRVSAVPGIERIRYTSPHPKETSGELIAVLAENLKVCKHMHLPLQSGSSRILQAMNRSYSKEHYLDLVARLKERIPGIAITTDIIVGFPGESDADFQETMDVLESAQFDSSFSFMFSQRPGTPAAAMNGQVPENVKLDRLQHYQARQEKITQARLALWRNKKCEVLLENESPQGFRGRNSQNIVVNFTAEGLALRPGMMVEVVITEPAKHTLKGEAVRVIPSQSKNL